MVCINCGLECRFHAREWVDEHGSSLCIPYDPEYPMQPYHTPVPTEGV